MLLVALEFDKAYNPVTISLLCPIRIVMISQNPADLIHESQFRIWFEFGLIRLRLNTLQLAAGMISLRQGLRPD